MAHSWKRFLKAMYLVLEANAWMPRHMHPVLRSALHSALARARATLRRKRAEDDLEEELRFHLEREIEYNVARGMTPDEARRAALTAFGGVQRVREETREARAFAVIDALGRDLRLAVRRLRRAPGFTAGVVATLAIGLGTAAGIGALVYGVMLRPLPYPEPDRLVQVSIATPGLGVTTTENSGGTFVYFRERARSFATLAAVMENQGIVLTQGDAPPERITGALVTTNVFAMLGTTPVVGRLFRPEDAVGDAVPVLLSYELWQRRFGSDPGIVGRYVELNRSRREVLGVLPAGFDFPSRAAAVYYPMEIESRTADLSYRYLTVVGRLRDGATVSSAQRELDALVPRLQERFPEMSPDAIRRTGLRAVVQTLRDAMVAPVRAELTLLALMVVLVLLIAIASAATLYLLRAERLRGEVAISRALGASRGALARRFAIEGLALGAASSIAALPAASVAVATKFGFAPGQIPRLYDVELSPMLIVCLAMGGAVAGVLLGFLALARAGGADSVVTVHGGARATGGVAWRRAQESLVAVQIALALALLLGAGLTARSLARLRAVDIGFASHGGAKFTLYLPYRGYPTYKHVAAFHLELLERLRAIPGVTAASAAMQFPLTPQLLASQPRVEAANDGRDAARASPTVNVVTPDFFQVMGIPLLRGRTFHAGDLLTPDPAVVISASLARELFGSADPLGREVRLAGWDRYPPYRVVGVIGDVYSDRIADGPLRVLYFPLLADLAPASKDTARIPYSPAGMNFVVRSQLPLATLAPAFRSAVRAMDSHVPIWDIRTLDAIVSAATARARLTMILLAVAAGATLLLGAIGLYSVIAYAVSGRSREFALRLALGASPRALMLSVLRDGVVVAAAGIVMGYALALAGTRMLRAVLYEVSATDVLTYVIAAGVVLLTILAATYPAARRAGRGDPAAALRVI